MANHSIIFDDNRDIVINRKSSIYISKKGNLETFGDFLDETVDEEYRGDDPKHEEQNKVLDNIAKAVKGKYQKSVLVNSVDASHYGYVNGNYAFYNPKFMKQNAKTFTTPIQKPVMKNHSDDADDILGRIVKADAIMLPTSKEEKANIHQPQGFIRTYSVITDWDAIQRIVDDRMMSVSIRSSSEPSEVRCSICGKIPAPFGDECEHMRGKEYTDEDGVKKLAFHIVDRQWYKEYSFVAHPADGLAKSTNYVMVNADSLGWETKQDDMKILMPKLSFYAGFRNSDADSSDNKTLINLKGEVIDLEDVLGTTIGCVDDICYIVPPGQGKVVKASTEAGKPEKLDNTNKDGGDSMPTPCKDCPDVLLADYAMLSTLETMLQNSMFSSADTVVNELTFIEHFDFEELTDDDMTLKGLLSKISDVLDELEDAKLTTAKRKKLPESVFCGPGRSFPVNDCAHVTAARRLIGRASVSSSTKAKILSCVNKREKTLGCDGSADGADSKKPADAAADTNPANDDAKKKADDAAKKKKDDEDAKKKSDKDPPKEPDDDDPDEDDKKKDKKNKKNKDEESSKFNFQSRDEILSSSIVTSYVDRINAEKDEVIHTLQAKIDEYEARAKGENVDQILKTSVALKLSTMKPYLEAKDAAAAATALKDIRESYLKKPVEVLDEILKIVSDQALVSAQPVQKDEITLLLETQLKDAHIKQGTDKKPDDKVDNKDGAPVAPPSDTVINPVPGDAGEGSTVAQLLTIRK